MKPFKKTKIFFIGLLLIIFTVLPYQLLWGKLFPFSPLKPGFNKYEFNNIAVYEQNGSEKYDYKSLDSLLTAVEEFHNFNFTQKPEIIFFRDADSYYQRAITKARFCAYPNGSLVVSPWAVKEALDGKISMPIYIKHELSHTLLYQHMNTITAYFFYPRWLLEGIAVYSSNQMGTSFYPDKSETYKYIQQGIFMPPEYFDTKKEDEIKLNVKYKIAFEYSEFACIVDYLIKRYGREKFSLYITQLLDSWHPDKVFEDVYKVDLNTCIDNFKQYVKEND